MPRRCALSKCEAKFVGGKLEIKNIEGSEYDIEADLIVSAIGQAVDFTGLEQFNNGKGAVSTDRNYVVAGQQGVFAGGDVIRPHLLTTAIGHGSIAADGIHNFLLGQDLEKRPKIDAHQFDLMRKLVEKGLEIKETHEPMRGTCNSNVAVHNFDNRSDRYIIPHDKLFLGHFSYVPRNVRNVVTLDKESALGNFQDRLGVLDEKAGRRRSQALHELRHVLRVRQLRGVLPADRRVPRQEDRSQRWGVTSRPITTSASAAISVPMFARPATFKWAWVSDEAARISAALPVHSCGLGCRSEHAQAGYRQGRAVREGYAMDAQEPYAPAQASAR